MSVFLAYNVLNFNRPYWAVDNTEGEHRMAGDDDAAKGLMSPYPGKTNPCR